VKSTTYEGVGSDFQANDNLARNPTFWIPAQRLVDRSDLNVSTSGDFGSRLLEHQLLCRSRDWCVPRVQATTSFPTRRAPSEIL